MALTVDVALLGGDDDDDDVGWTWTVDFGRPLHHRQAQRKKESRENVRSEVPSSPLLPLRLRTCSLSSSPFRLFLYFIQTIAELNWLLLTCGLELRQSSRRWKIKAVGLDW